MANPRKFSEKIALHNQKQAEETAEFEKIMKEVSDATSKPGSVEAGKGTGYRERARSSLGPMRRATGEKRADTSPYSSAYLSPPPDTGWRRTHSDSSLHTSSQEQILVQRRATVDKDAHFNSDPLRRNISSPVNHEGGRSSSDLSRIPCISILSTNSDQGHIPISKKIGSLPDLTSFHFPSPLGTPLDQDDRGQQYSSTSGMISGGYSPDPGHHDRMSKFKFGSSPHEAPGPPQAPPYSNQGLNQQQVCQQQFIYQHPLSPLQPPSPQPVPNQQTNTLNCYRTPSRPSPQSSPSLSIRFNVGSPRSNSPQSPSSPASVGGGMSPFPDHNNYFINQQTTALQHHFENFSMDDNVAQLTPDPGYFSTSPHFSNRVSTAVNTQTAPNTPSSIPDIVLTDFSNSDELAKDLGVAMATSLDTDLFPTDDCLRSGLEPLDLDGLQMLSDPDMITDSTTEDHFRLDRL